MAGQLPEPHDPSPDDPYRPPPKHREPTYPPGRDETAQSMAEQGRGLPVAHGRVKLPVLVIERLTPLQQDPPQWTALTQYAPGFIVQNGGNGYEVTSGGVGTSAASGGPSGSGVGITDGTVIWKFRQQLPMPIFIQRFIGAVCEGEVATAIAIWIDKTFFAAASGTIFVQAMELKKGPDAGGQTLTTGMGWDSIGYQHTALIQPVSGMVGIPSGTQKEMPQLAVELDTVMLGASTPDVNPGDWLNDILTHARRGCVWPSSRVDTSITGTAAGGYRVYCDAAGFRFSMAMTEARFARDWIADVLIATNSEAVWSGGKLKVVPRGDQDIPSPVYGATGYVSANLVQYALGPNDFRRASWTRRKDPECFNTWPVEYTDRAGNYARLTQDSPDALDVEKRSVLNGGSGKATAQTVSLPVVFPDGTPAVLLSGILTQRSLYDRNTYRIDGVPWRYVLTEPTDVITLTDPVSGLSLQPMRIIEWEEGPDGETIDITAEDYGTAVQQAARYTPQAGDGAKPQDAMTVASIPTVIVDTRTTRSGAVDNIFPNHTSEYPAPDTADTTTPEFAGRVTTAAVGPDGLAAFAGSWVRQLTALSGARQLLGDVALDSATIIKPAYQSQLGFRIRCSPGESFYIESEVRFVSPSTVGDGAGVGIAFLDANLQLITASPMWGLALWGVSLWGSAGIVSAPASFPSAWALATAFAKAPAGTVFAHFYLYADSDQGQVTAQFDAIYARRQIDAGLLQNDPWTGLSYLNSWAMLTSTTVTPGYFKDLFGKVQLRGTIASGTMSASAANLPAGYRPTADMRFVVDSNGAYGRVTITAAGDIIPDVGSNVAISLDGILFDTRN